MKVCFSFGHLDRPDSITKTTYSLGFKSRIDYDLLALVLEAKRELDTTKPTASDTPDVVPTPAGAVASITSQGD